MHLGAKKIAKGETAHASSSVMAQASPVSHWQAEKPRQSGCCWTRFKGFWGKLMFDTFQLGSLVSTISKSQQIQTILPDKDDGCRRQPAAGDNGCIVALQLFLATWAAYLVLSL